MRDVTEPDAYNTAETVKPDAYNTVETVKPDAYDTVETEFYSYVFYHKFLN